MVIVICVVVYLFWVSFSLVMLLVVFIVLVCFSVCLVRCICFSGVGLLFV